jgi:hypothetical protein
MKPTEEYIHQVAELAGVDVRLVRKIFAVMKRGKEEKRHKRRIAKLTEIYADEIPRWDEMFSGIGKTKVGQ